MTFLIPHWPKNAMMTGLVLFFGLFLLQMVKATYPERPIRLISIGAPGGTPDILSRKISAGLSAIYSQPVIVDNRPGGSGVLSADLVAKAPPDGYTLYMTYHQHTVNATLITKLPYRAIDDFTPITQVTAAPLILAVHPSAPVKNLQEFLTWTKSFKGPLSYGSAGIGSGGHLSGELYNLMTGVKAEHIPYKSSSAALIDLAANQYQFNFTGVQTAAPYLRSARLKPIAITSITRSKSLPDLPTLDESGLAGFEFMGWYGMLAPAKLNTLILNRLNKDIIVVANDSKFKESISLDGSEVMTNTPQVFGQFLMKDVQKWAKVLKQSGAKVE
jgi:tripartite-type tricarboxylate transporter receptor subunit TctC